MLRARVRSPVHHVHAGKVLSLLGDSMTHTQAIVAKSGAGSDVADLVGGGGSECNALLARPTGQVGKT